MPLFSPSPIQKAQPPHRNPLQQESPSGFHKHFREAGSAPSWPGDYAVPRPQARKPAPQEGLSLRGVTFKRIKREPRRTEARSTPWWRVGTQSGGTAGPPHPGRESRTMPWWEKVFAGLGWVPVLCFELLNTRGWLRAGACEESRLGVSFSREEGVLPNSTARSILREGRPRVSQRSHGTPPTPSRSPGKPRAKNWDRPVLSRKGVETQAAVFELFKPGPTFQNGTQAGTHRKGRHEPGSDVAAGSGSVKQEVPPL